MPKVAEKKIDLKAVKADAKIEFGKIAGVQGFGLGESSVRIYVTNDNVKEKIPSAYRGVAIEFVNVGNIIAR